MLKKIKSLFIIKKLFKHIDISKKLKLIKYNKSLQKSIYFSINNYIHFKGKYIIYKSNEIGEEYNGYNNKLVYAGGILNGQRNGKGKEYYDSGNLKFEGEYLNGKEFIGNKYKKESNKEYQYNKDNNMKVK